VFSVLLFMPKKYSKRLVNNINMLLPTTPHRKKKKKKKTEKGRGEVIRQIRQEYLAVRFKLFFFFNYSSHSFILHLSGDSLSLSLQNLVPEQKKSSQGNLSHNDYYCFICFKSD
jgi:hypothetical protein